MADIEFLCPECSGELVIDETGAGLDVACPHCKAVIKVPLPDSDSSPEEQPEDQPEETPSGGLHFKKDPKETWVEHAEEAGQHVKQALVGLKPIDEINSADLHEKEHSNAEVQEGEPAPSDLHVEHHAGTDTETHTQDVNIDQPWFKKKDHWFTSNGKKYHYCYYNPHAPVMITACNDEPIPVSADIAPDDCGGLRKKSLCKPCLKMLGLTADEVLAGS
jgi:DNA-directed RNA polymerase subunit RPC12/RpoP